MQITAEMGEFYRANGYCVLEGAIPPETLAALRETCDTALNASSSTKGLDLELGDRRRFLNQRHEEFPEAEKFVLGDVMASIVRPLIGEESVLFNEQFVVKGPHKGASFGWHQDSGYVPFDHPTYLTLWCALDDATPENGAVRVLPRDLRVETDVIDHRWDEETRELVGYDGDHEGVMVACPAGTVVAFSSLTLHTSGPNTTAKARRAYVCQYSPEPIVKPDTGEFLHFAKPLARAAA